MERVKEMLTATGQAQSQASRPPAPHTKPAAMCPPAREQQGLVGIARLAAESPQVHERAEVEFFALESRSALNRESSGRLPFAWTLNPYRCLLYTSDAADE